MANESIELKTGEDIEPLCVLRKISLKENDILIIKTNCLVSQSVVDSIYTDVQKKLDESGFKNKVIVYSGDFDTMVITNE